MLLLRSVDRLPSIGASVHDHTYTTIDIGLSNAFIAFKDRVYYNRVYAALSVVKDESPLHAYTVSTPHYGCSNTVFNAYRGLGNSNMISYRYIGLSVELVCSAV